MTKLCGFNQDNPPPTVSMRFSSLKDRAGLLVMRWGCRLGDGQSYCRCSKWPSLATTVWWSSPPPCWCVLVQMVCRATFNSSVVLGSGLAGVYGTSPAWRPGRYDSLQQDQRGHSIFSTNTGEFTCSQFCVTLGRWDWVKAVVLLKRHNFVICRYSSTKSRGKCSVGYILV